MAAKSGLESGAKVQTVGIQAMQEEKHRLLSRRDLLLQAEYPTEAA